MLLSMKKLTKEYGGPICRACLNEMSGVHLRRKNCWYVSYQGICPRCNQDDKNLVAKLRFSGKVKVMLHARPGRRV